MTSELIDWVSLIARLGGVKGNREVVFLDDAS